MDKKARRSVIKRDNHRCILCGSNIIEVHHIIYRSHGGTDDKRNLVCLCKRHHEQVHSDEPYWREYLLNRQRGIYGMIEINDLKKHGKYAEFKYGN